MITLLKEDCQWFPQDQLLYYKDTSNQPLTDYIHNNIIINQIREKELDNVVSRLGINPNTVGLPQERFRGLRVQGSHFVPFFFSINVITKETDHYCQRFNCNGYVLYIVNSYKFGPVKLFVRTP